MPKILIVDDDELFRKMLRLTLERLGHSVREARDGKEASGVNRHEPAEIVITDLIMPDMEGLELIQELRRTCPGLGIVAMSGGGRINAADYLKVALMLGADCTLTKPFSNSELTAAITVSAGRPGQLEHR